MRALGYIRVSTAEQASSGHSLDNQRERIAAWCVARGLALVDVVVDDGVSAAKALAKRKGGADLLARLAAGAADVVVVVAIDRLFRDAQDGMNTIYGLGREDGMPVQSVTEPIDTTSAMGRFVLTIWLAKCQLEREQTCERNQAIAAGLRKSGRVYGATPYGCVAVGGRWDPQRGRMVGQKLARSRELWPHRELIVQLRKGGESLQAIVDTLIARRIASPEGKRRWSKSAVARVMDTHDGLKHLPLLPVEHEPAVSHAGPSAHTPAQEAARA